LYLSLSLRKERERIKREKEKSVRAEMRKSSSLFFVGKKEKERKERKERKIEIQLTRAQNTKKPQK